MAKLNEVVHGLGPDCCIGFESGHTCIAPDVGRKGSLCNGV